MIVGDIHGRFGYLNKLINKRAPEVIICCGDFGIWPNIPLSSIKNHNCKVYFCEGNHENYNELKKIRRSKEPVEIYKNIFYMSRGSKLTLNGKNILFFGGAESVDKEYRIEGHNWFPEESITTEQINSLRKQKIDIVISHTAPGFIIESMGRLKRAGTSPTLLEYVHELYKPNCWFFGHMHETYQSLVHGIMFYGLNMAPNDGWWRYLEVK